MNKGPAFLLRLGVGAALTGCANCADSGLCRVAPGEGTATASSPTASYAPGTRTRVKLEVNRISVTPNDLLALGTTHPDARALGPLGLASFDGGQVRVTWDGRPFTADNADITVTVAEGATITGTDPAHIYTTTMQTYIQRANTTLRAGSVTHSILVNPQGGRGRLRIPVVAPFLPVVMHPVPCEIPEVWRILGDRKRRPKRKKQGMPAAASNARRVTPHSDAPAGPHPLPVEGRELGLRGWHHAVIARWREDFARPSSGLKGQSPNDSARLFQADGSTLDVATGPPQGSRQWEEAREISGCRGRQRCRW